MAEEVIDIIHKLTYIVEDEKLKAVSNEIANQVTKLDVLGKQAKRLADIYDRTSTAEIAKRDRIKKLIVETQKAIEKEGDAIEHTILNNKELNTALQKQIGVIGALEQKMQLLRDRRDRAFDPDRIKQYNQQLHQAEREMSALQGAGIKKEGGGLFGSIVGGNIAANVIQGAAAALKGFASDIVSTTAKYEKLSALLANTLGGKQAGADAFKLLTDFAAETPFQLDELTASYLKLVNRGIKPTKEELTAFGDIAAAQGKSFDQFTEAVLDATTGEFERLKEFGIKATQQGDLVNLTFGNITKTVPKTADAIKKALLEIRNQAPGIAGAMKVISGTIEGQLSNLSDGFDRLKNNLGGGFKDSIKSLIGDVSDLVGWMSDLVEVPVEEKLRAEQIELNSLFGILVDTNTENEVRVRVMQELNQKYPELLNNINLETANSNELLSLLNGINLAYEVRIKKAGATRLAEKAAKGADAELDDLTERLQDLGRIAAKAGLPANTTIGTVADIERLKEEGKISAATGLAMMSALSRVQGSRERYNEKLQESISLTKAFGKVGEEEDARVADRIAELNKLIEELTAKNVELKKEGGILNAGFVIFNEQAIKNARAELLGLQNGLNVGTAAATTTPPPAAKAAAAKAKKEKVDADKPFNDAIKAENERFEKEKSEREAFYNKKRLAAREKFGDDDAALAKEFLKIKEAQDLDLFNRETENQKSHLNRLTAIYVQFHKQREVDAVKNSSLIIKNQEDEAARLAAIAKRTQDEADKQAAAVLDSANRRIAAERSAIDKATEQKLGRNERVKNIAITEVNKSTSKKAAEKIVAAIEQEFKQNELDIKIEAIKIKLNKPTLNLTPEEKEKLENELASLLKDKSEISSANEEQRLKTISDIEAITNASTESANAIIANEQRILDAQIRIQEGRVAAAQRIAEKGNAELLQREEKRLRELQKKRENAAKAELITNNLLTISNAVLAVAKAAAAGFGYASIATVAAVIAALVAGYSAVRTLTNDTPAFAKGEVDIQGPGTTKSDSIHARISKGESVMTSEATQKYKNILVEMNAMRYHEPVRIPNDGAKGIIEGRANELDYRNSFGRLEKRLGAIEEAIITRPNTSVTMDRDGIAVSVEQVITRREKMRNL